MLFVRSQLCPAGWENSVLELPLVLLAGALGSSHCLGMCGPFALSIGSGAATWWGNLRRQATFSLGRIFTYTTFGAAAGFGGLRLSQAVPTMVNLPAVMAVVAGLFLIYQGLQSAGVVGGRTGQAGSGPCITGSFFSAFLHHPGRMRLFLAGMFTGMLPCGLVYGFLALAASSASMSRGAATMAVFGLGTVPLMIVAGLSGTLLTWGARQRLLRVAAWCVVLAGVVSIVRGAGFVQIPGLVEAVGCPYCF